MKITHRFICTADVKVERDTSHWDKPFNVTLRDIVGGSEITIGIPLHVVKELAEKLEQVMQDADACDKERMEKIIAARIEAHNKGN